jgi:hypothetical protein
VTVAHPTDKQDECGVNVDIDPCKATYFPLPFHNVNSRGLNWLKWGKAFP